MNETAVRQGPIRTTRIEVERALLDAMKGILGSGVASTALRAPSKMVLADIETNLHLYERLGIAMAALGALRGYDDKPRGFEIQKDNAANGGRA